MSNFSNCIGISGYISNLVLYESVMSNVLGTQIHFIIIKSYDWFLMIWDAHLDSGSRSVSSRTKK